MSDWLNIGKGWMAPEFRRKFGCGRAELSPVGSLTSN